MKAYKASVPHVLIGIAALAMTTATLAMAVVVPATSDCARDVPRIAAAGAVPSPTIEVAIVPTRIEVVGTRASAT